MKFKHKKPAGVTIVEMLLYLALFSIVIGLIVYFVSFSVETNRKASERIEIQKNLIFLNEHLQDNFKISDSIDDASSIFDNNTGKITLKNGVHTYTYEISGGKLRSTIDGDSDFLTSSYHQTLIFNVKKMTNSKNKVSGARITITLASKSVSSIQEEFEMFYLLK